jgi:hypothetical protein
MLAREHASVTRANWKINSKIQTSATSNYLCVLNALNRSQNLILDNAG